MDPERIKILQECERAYVNGVPDEDGNIQWPTYRSLAADHTIPIRVINEQAAKHRWNARREQRKGKLIYFKQQQQMRQWQEMDREFTVHATEAAYKLQFVVNRKIQEAYQDAVQTYGKEQDAASKGKVEFHQMQTKTNELRTLVATLKDLNEAQAARASRAQALPLGYEDVQVPDELPTATEERAQLESTEAANLTKIEDILMLLVENQQRYDKSNEVISGELDDGDDDGLAGVGAKIR